VLRFLILALCLVAIVVPLPVIAIALYVGLAVATWLGIETTFDVQRVARLAVTPLRAPPTSSLR